MWIVGINRPYYPSIYFYKEIDKNKAIKMYHELLQEHSIGGEYECIVFMSWAEQTSNITTDY